MLQLTTIENKETTLAGDMNCNYLVPKDHKQSKDVLQINGFKQLSNKDNKEYEDSN